MPAPDGSGNKAIDWNGTLDRPAQSVDQRTKYPVWMQEFERRGGTLEIREADHRRPRRLCRRVAT